MLVSLESIQNVAATLLLRMYSIVALPFSFNFIVLVSRRNSFLIEDAHVICFSLPISLGYFASFVGSSADIVLSVIVLYAFADGAKFCSSDYTVVNFSKSLYLCAVPTL